MSIMVLVNPLSNRKCSAADAGRTRFCNVKQIAPQAACGQCALGKLCFPHALPALYQTLLPLVCESRLRLKRGEFLFNIGEQQTGVHAVMAGFLKTGIRLPDGQEKVVGFHAMGDALGLDGLGDGRHATSAVALSDCEVCVIPLAKFQRLLEHNTESVHVRQLLARAIARAEMHAAAVGMLSAKQLLAGFLLDMSARWEERGYSKNEFVLFMSRKEIGSYLGLTFETVGRTLSYFHSKTWITVDGKNVLIRDMPALRSQLTRAS